MASNPRNFSSFYSVFRLRKILQTCPPHTARLERKHHARAVDLHVNIFHEESQS